MSNQSVIHIVIWVFYCRSFYTLILYNMIVFSWSIYSIIQTYPNQIFNRFPRGSPKKKPSEMQNSSFSLSHPHAAHTEHGHADTSTIQMMWAKACAAISNSNLWQNAVGVTCHDRISTTLDSVWPHNAHMDQLRIGTFPVRGKHDENGGGSFLHFSLNSLNLDQWVQALVTQHCAHLAGSAQRARRDRDHGNVMDCTTPRSLMQRVQFYDVFGQVAAPAPPLKLQQTASFGTPAASSWSAKNGWKRHNGWYEGKVIARCHARICFCNCFACYLNATRCCK